MSNAAHDGPIGGLRQTAVKGAFFTSLAQLAKVIVQFGSVIILSRLLSPADFGLLAMVAPVYGLALIFQDMGLGHATVQSAQVTPAQSNSLFWLNVAVASCLAVPLTFGCASGRLVLRRRTGCGLTRGFAAVIVVGALGAQHSALLNRSMRFRFLAALDTFSVLAGFLGAVLLAAAFHTYWALFASYAIGASVNRHRRMDRRRLRARLAAVGGKRGADGPARRGIHQLQLLQLHCAQPRQCPDRAGLGGRCARALRSRVQVPSVPAAFRSTPRSLG